MSGDEKKPAGKPPAARDGVRHDARGNAVWQWAVDTGKHALDSTSRLLKRLEVPGLKLEDDAAAPGAPESKPGTPAGPAAGGGAGPGRPAKVERATGYDPYGTRAGAKAAPARPAAPRAAPGAPPVRKPAAASPPRPSLWRRLFRRD